MQWPMLVIDKNIEVSQREQVEWLKYGISTIRVDTMQEAIGKLTKESFLFTAINADNINYLPLLKTMRNTAPTFIFIIDTNYTAEKEVKALHNGADVFTKFNSNVELNVRLALAQLLRCNERDKQPKMPAGMIIYDGFLVSASSHQIFCNDINIKLTKKEYDLLHYLIANHDIALTYRKIYRRVWGDEYDEASPNAIWDYILKLRKKIKEIAGDYEYIENVREVGYKFTSPHDK